MSVSTAAHSCRRRIIGASRCVRRASARVSASGHVGSVAGEAAVSGGRISRVAGKSAVVLAAGRVAAACGVSASGWCCWASAAVSCVGGLGGWNETSICFSKRRILNTSFGYEEEDGLCYVSLEVGVQGGDWLVEELGERIEWVLWMSCASVVSTGLDRGGRGSGLYFCLLG